MIIHITGPSGSGKTTLGNQLVEKFGRKIVVKDIDDLRTEFIHKYYGNRRWTKINKIAYQTFINKFISDHNKKPLIWVGLNIMPWWHANHYYNMHADHKFYINIDSKTIHVQKCERFLSKLGNLHQNEKYDMINNNERFLRLLGRSLTNECNEKLTNESSKKLAHDYAKQNYTFDSREKIFAKVIKLLSSK